MKIGLITYHAAYNYGSILQAYATQCAVERLGYSIEIINYRMKEQQEVYSLYRTKFGLKTFIKDLLQLPIHSQRKKRQMAFESFLVNHMRLSKVCSVPQEVYKVWEQYDVIISGSDQIWNKHSLELEHNAWDYMKPYLLEGYRGIKISYASSIANMTDSELDYIIKNIMQFSNVSLREKSSVKRLEMLYDLKTENVVDPTFLLSKEDWIKNLQLHYCAKEKYILYYSLDSLRAFKKNVTIIRQVAKERDCKLVVVAPFAYTNVEDEILHLAPDLGPVEFLNMLYNAESVITNSYHGTILSINFEKDVYSLCEPQGAEFRKTDFLNEIGVSDRIVWEVNELLSKRYVPINYEQVKDKINKLRQNSYIYLEKALDFREQ